MIENTSLLALSIWRLSIGVALCFLSFLVSAAPEDAAVSESPYFWIEGGDDAIDRFPLKSTETRVQVLGSLAEVTISQVYANEGDRTIEARYVFPGSTRAAVHGLEMAIGERVVVAEIQRKAQARETYETAKRAGQTASLLEQHRPNVFQMNLANILPGAVVRVTLRYTEWLVREQGQYALVLPAVVGPRYASNSSRADESAETWVDNPYLGGGAPNPATYYLSVDLSPGVPIEQIVCGTHDVDIKYADESAANVWLSGDASKVGNRDFVLRYRVSGAAVKSGLLLSESNGEKYFLATLQPPKSDAPRPRIAREYIFVVDVSGSMSGFPLDTARRMMGELAMELDEDDRFNILLFAGASQIWSPVSQPATIENIQLAIRFMDTARSGGGTELMPALERAYAMPREEAISRSIVILTDGFVTVEESAFELVRARLNEASVFACGIGSSVNRHLIEGLANVGMGEAFIVTKPADAAPAARRFSAYVSQPVLSGVRVSFEGFDAYDVEPIALPDLLAERPLYVYGKWRGEAQGSVSISGRSGESEYAHVIEVGEAKRLTGSRALEYVWTRERIRRLSDYNRLWRNDERVEEVTRLGLIHSLLTAYTSFVAVDKQVRAEPNAATPSIAQPLAMPAGGNPSAIGSGQSVPVTPEPSMVTLLGCVAAALGWIGWRRSRARRLDTVCPDEQ